MVNTIRDENSVCDTSYDIKRVFTNVSFSSGQATLSASSPESFKGDTTDTSDSNKSKFYLATCTSAGGSSYSVGDIISFNGSGQSIVVSGSGNTAVTLNDGTSNSFSADTVSFTHLTLPTKRIV